MEQSYSSEEQLIKVVDDIIYNEEMHVVSVFKDYLIYDDIGEFLKRHYFTEESKFRLVRLVGL